MPRDVPSLSDAELGRVTEVLVAWSEVHPRPHLPLIQLVDGSELTPRDIGRAAVDGESRYGLLLQRVFAAAMIEDGVEEVEPLDWILGDFERDTVRWQAEGFGETIG